MFEKLMLNLRVKDAFQELNLELLPEEINKNFIVKWILDFSSEVDKPFNFDQYYIDEPLYEEVTKLLKQSIKSNLTFYLATIFSIGRQWKTSMTAIELIQKALSKENLNQSVAQNRNLFLEILRELNICYSNEEIDNGIEETIKSTLLRAQKDHQHKIHLAEANWVKWLEEVEDYKKILEISQNKLSLHLEERTTRKQGKVNFVEELTNFITIDYLDKDLYSTLRNQGISLKRTYDERKALENLLDFSTFLFKVFGNRDAEEIQQYYQVYLKKSINRIHWETSKLKRNSKV
ncbi:hypothetical protein FZD47_10635 [Bacillus infantis]|uniref:Uncharacterized protein n=1 Tax=Bacillus infantis TaxID=324767 RepID=A0A5D4SMK0_9BACI|nr:hypothetical protein [Bacillus infantis]TYS63951.1 hypothetical protein FZD47_10635 [Bacillus infantis]